MKLNKTQVTVVLGAVTLIVLLTVANTKAPKKAAEIGTSEHAGNQKAETVDLLEVAKNSLTPSQKQTFNELDAALSVSSTKRESFENTIHQWDSLRKPVIAAHYKEQEAEAFPSDKNWEEAGSRYYAITRFVKDGERNFLYDKAIACFEKTLEINPNNTDVKIDLASCYVDRGVDPMKGIGMLKAIEKTDSNNIKLQLSFAFFSIKSGQLDKAVKRFEKVLKIQPDFIEAYLHLADIYEQKGDKVKTIENLQKYVALTDDITLKNEVKGYINKLKN